MPARGPKSIPARRGALHKELQREIVLHGGAQRSRRMGETGSAIGRAPGESRGGLRLLQLAAFFSSFDRFAVAPMLVTIAASLGASLAETTATASLYYLLYGGMQPVWGMLSDRLGGGRGKDGRAHV